MQVSSSCLKLSALGNEKFEDEIEKVFVLRTVYLLNDVGFEVFSILHGRLLSPGQTFV